MSHYAVLVIGEDPEEQLAPFDENISVQRYDRGEVSEEDKKSFIEHYTKDQGTKYDGDFAKLYKQHGKSWNNNDWRFKNGKWMETSTYNPKSKWDWYSLGGRFSGMIKLKKGKKGRKGQSGVFDNEIGIDQARKGDIDFVTIRNQAEKEAAKAYAKAQEIFGDTPVNETFEAMRERMGTDDMDAVRKAYWDQPRCKAWKKANAVELFGFFSSPDEFMGSRDEYIRRAGDSSFTTLAVLKDGEWYERGEMGWWGMVHNEKDRDEWNQEFTKLLEGLPDDTLLSIYDLHI